MKNTEKLIFIIFIIALIIAWSPSKILPYMLPMIAMSFVLLTFLRSVYVRFILLILFFFLWIGFSIIFTPDIIYQNFLLSFITYSSYYAIFLLPSKLLKLNPFYERTSKILLIVIIIQALIGFFQIGAQFSRIGTFDSYAGDVVEGTIDLALKSGGGLESPSYAANMMFSILFLMPLAGKRKKMMIPILLFCFFAFLLTATMHLLIFVLISIILTFLIRSLNQKMSKWYLVILFLLLIFMIFAYVLMPVNLGVLLPKYIQNINTNPKVLVLLRTFEKVEKYPQILLAGLGPGQGVSRSALIGTGDYLRVSVDKFGINYQLPSFLEETQYFDLFNEFNTPNYGTTHKPISSWLALITEMGFVGMIVCILYIGKMVIIPVNRIKLGKEEDLLLFAFRSGVLFLFFMGFQDFYWEYPQAIFLGLVLLKLLHAKMLEKDNAEK